MKEIPLETALKSKEPAAIAKWLWKIHNCVNSKLRDQNLNSAATNPPFASVKKLYTAKFAAGCTKTNFEGWEFLFSVVENHPFSKGGLSGTAISGAPDPTVTDPADTLELNRWNMLPAAKRQVFYEQFWECLPAVLPYPEWKRVWDSCEKDWSSKQTAMKTLWGIRCSMESALQLMNKTNYHSLCKELRTHRSGCSKSARARTCRKKRV